MLILKDEYDVIHNFVLLDAHTHLRVNKLEGLVPSEFVRRYSKVVKDVVRDIKKSPKEYRYHFPWKLKNISTDYYQFCQRDIYTVFHPGEELSKAPEKYSCFDFIISFSANLTSPLPRDYRNANSRVRETLIEKSPDDNSPHNNFRFIGFGRLDPNHSDSLDTFDNVCQLGLRGLKLHPKEEQFEINDAKTKYILKRAANNNMPIIFHTQDGMASNIEEVVNETISDFIDADKTDLIPRLKVILGHAPWNGVGNKKLYRALSHPNIFGELSTLKPDSYEDFFSSAKKDVKYERIFDVKQLSELDKKTVERLYFNAFGYNKLNYWSSKLMFGSDTPYPPSHGATPLIKHMLSKRFVGNASDIQNILAVSALRLIPPIARANPQITREKATTSGQYHPMQLEIQKKDSKILGMDPILEVFPKVRISGAVFSFLKNGDVGSYLYKSLFSPKKPLNTVIPNPINLPYSSMTTSRVNMTRNIEMSLGEE
ncbi:MAG: amidohydrolase family protein [Thermoplasmata archaeon]|nr:MAG: amidohydrolase family protein [Thermoplasmata archaeon]